MFGPPVVWLFRRRQVGGPLAALIGAGVASAPWLLAGLVGNAGFLIVAVFSLPLGAVRWVSGKLEVYDGHRQIVHPDRVVDEAGFASMPLTEPVYGVVSQR